MDSERTVISSLSGNCDSKRIWGRIRNNVQKKSCKSLRSYSELCGSEASNTDSFDIGRWKPTDAFEIQST